MDNNPSSIRLTPRDWEQLRSLAEGLKEAWRNADSVDLLPFIRSVDGPLRLRYLEELIKTDLEMRYRRGHPCVLEDYLRQFPELGAAARLPTELIYQEYRLRQIHGDHPPLSLYRERFPEQFEQLQRRLVSEPFGTLAPGTPATVVPPKWSPSTEDDDVSFTTRTFPPTVPPEGIAPRDSAPADGNEGVGFTARTILPTIPPAPASAGRFANVSATPPATDPFAIAGKRIGGGYILKKPLGAGQYGEVFLAEAPGGIEVAIKRLFRPLSDEGSKRELQALDLIRSLRHPYLMTTHAFWEEEDRLHIVMELADESLMDRFNAYRAKGQPGIPVNELLRFFTEAAEALDFLHHQPKPILHRDIKPANLLYLEGHAKVADFGLARLYAENLTSATFCGTPLYMAPEIWREQISVHSDQYSLAAAYAEMCQGKRVYAGTSQAALCQQHMGAPPELVGFNEAEQKVLRKAMAKDPNQRFPSCLSFMQALAVAHAPPPEPKTGSAFSHRLFLLLTVLLLGVSGLSSWLLINRISTPIKKKTTIESAPWLPLDFKVVDDRIKRGYYSAISGQLPDDVPVVFLLIPSGDDAHPPFYIMRDKVTNGQFEAALRDPRMLIFLLHWSKEHPWTVQPRTIEAAKGKKGGKRPDGDSELPWMNVTVTEACGFAELLGGKLPTQWQWDKAGGRFDGDGPGNTRPLTKPWKGEGVAVKRDRPVPVGTSLLDISEFGCRDMAGNGRELTRDIVDPRDNQLVVPLARPYPTAQVFGRGKEVTGDEPFRFALLSDPDSGYPEQLDYARPRGNVGFRVVIEPPLSPSVK